MKILKRKIFGIYNNIVSICLKPILLSEYKSPSFNIINERSVEYAFVFKHLYQICPKEVLDVGTGLSALPHLMANCGFKVTAIDEMQSYWKSSFINRHYWVVRDDIKNSKITKKFDLITCISALEHIPNCQAVRGMFKLLRAKGYLIVTFPYNEEEYIENVYKLPGAGYGRAKPYVCQVFSKKEVNKWIKENNGRIVDQEYYEVFTGYSWAFGERVYPPHKVTKQERHHLTCILIQKA